MNILKELARTLVGGLFIFSGAIKVNDPVGTAIKLEEYFQVFSDDITPLFDLFVPYALFLAVFLSVLEVVLGVALLVGFKNKINLWILLGLITFFTFLTFYSAYFNKVTDCGCFGDAIKLTPWQSFYKDIILILLIIFLFIYRNSLAQYTSEKLGMAVTLASTVVFVSLSVIAIANLPFIDFRSYAVGKDIPKLMQPSGELKYAYVMENNGVEEEFNEFKPAPYKFIELKILNPEVEPKIADFAVYDEDGNDFTNEILNGDQLLFIFHNVESASLKNIEKFSNLIKASKKTENKALTSSGYKDFEKFRHIHQMALKAYFVDATVLKTMIRSNPGIIFLRDGVVMGKWHYNNTPSLDELEKLLDT